MREIKFRAWFKREGKFKEDFMDVNIMTSFGSDLYVIEQYTGLKDKNGVEIYEGDIVISGRFSTQSSYQIINTESTVSFKDGMFKAGNVSLCSFTGGLPKEKCEVIGNIHEESK